jgi:hypothetical protein
MTEKDAALRGYKNDTSGQDTVGSEEAMNVNDDVT